MRPDPDKPYYSAYEKRYRCVYNQGIKYWSNFPGEIADTKRIVNDFIDLIKPAPAGKVIEFGCGEAYLADYFVKKDFLYTGVDISESAINKAQTRWKNLGRKALFMVGDITKLPSVNNTYYDIGIDVSCLHMLVLENDRQNYLKNAYNLINKNGYMLFCRQICSNNAVSKDIRSYDEWLGYSGQSVDDYEMRHAYKNGRKVTVSIPMIAARAQPVEQYKQELEYWDFEFLKILSNSRGRLSFFAKKGSDY